VKFLDGNWNIFDPCGSKNSSIAFNLGRGSHGFLVIVRKLDCWPPVNLAELANKAYGIESIVSVWIAVSKIVGQIRSPTSAQAYSVFRKPLLRIKEIHRATKVYRGGAIAYRASEVRMQGKNKIDVKSV
jgi:hypothetical protein